VDRREYTTRQDIYYNYCLWEYKPVVPHEGKFRSVNLLIHSFEMAGVDERMFALVGAIREAIGISNTVWGVKWSGKDIGWEFYFYDYRRGERERSITRVLQAVKPFIPCEIKANENYFYFMFSMDINNELVLGTKNLEEVHIYIGIPGSAVSSGVCYALTNTGTKLENIYFFFDPKRHQDDIINKIFCSVHIDSTRIDIDEILWPELRTCKTICLANKQRNDCVYFSGIDIDQLIFFLTKMDYPRKLRSFVEENRCRLDHLRYDVGFDYRMEGNRLKIMKSGYYGNF
jgi:hypothetical protein